LATTFGLVTAGASSFALAATSITLIPLLSHLARRLSLAVQQSRPLDPVLAVAPRSRSELQDAAGQAGLPVSRGTRPKTPQGSLIDVMARE